MSELFEMDSLLVDDTDITVEENKVIQESFDNLEKAIQSGNTEAAFYYLGELNDLCDVDKIQETRENSEELSFGSKEKDDLERQLSNAKANYRNAEKALNTLLNDKLHGMKGVDPAISNREYQLKIYAREISQLQRQISQIKE